MPSKALRLAALLLALLPFAAPLPTARADGDGDKPAEPAKKPTTDDTSIFADWQLVKRRGIAHAKERAAFWESKAQGKDLFFLGLMWNRGESFDKAAGVLQQFLEWKPPTGDDKDSTKIREAAEKNREPARRYLLTALLWSKKYADAVKQAEEFRKEFTSASAEDLANVSDDEGQALRLLGEDDKAAAAFAKCAEAKILKGLLDLVDVYLCNGKVDDAKAAFEKYPMEAAKQTLADEMKAFVALIGTDAPSIEKAVSVGRGDAPTSYKGKATGFYFWHLQLSDGENRILQWNRVFRDAPNAQAIAIGTYNKYNPEVMKKDEAMTEEAEHDWYKKMILSFQPSFPAAIVVPKDTLTALALKREGQTVIVDAEGKIRYTRVSDTGRYDKEVIKLALKKFGGG